MSSKQVDPLGSPLRNNDADISVLRRKRTRTNPEIAVDWGTVRRKEPHQAVKLSIWEVLEFLLEFLGKDTFMIFKISEHLH